jgi:hypothetical protein
MKTRRVSLQRFVTYCRGTIATWTQKVVSLVTVGIKLYKDKNEQVFHELDKLSIVLSFVGFCCGLTFIGQFIPQFTELAPPPVPVPVAPSSTSVPGPTFVPIPPTVTPYSPLADVVTLVIRTPGAKPAISQPRVYREGQCSWRVVLTLTGFEPKNWLYIHSRYRETVCETGELVSSSWSVDTSTYTPPELGLINPEGTFEFEVTHHGIGDYRYTFRDAQGNSAQITFTTQ